MEEELFNESRLFTQREYFANGLINLFKSKELWLEEGVSISIEGEWGIGKTFFKDKFKEMLNTEHFVVLEYNAWKNDYNDDPFSSLISSIISQMENLVNKSDYTTKSILRNKLDAVKNSTVDMLGRLIKASPKIIADRLLGTFDEAIRDACEQAIFNNEKTERIEKIFRIALRDFISEYYKQLKEGDFDNLEMKIIILVDELDRCRPDYALKVLERIKHFFNIPDYIFVFLNNKSEIEKSIEHIYGSENGSRYLEKFFDFQLKLPEPDKESYIQILYEKAIEKYKSNSFEEEMFTNFKVYLKKYCNYFSLRVIDKMFRYYGLIISLDKIDTFYKMKHLPLHLLRKYDLNKKGEINIYLIEPKDKIFNIPLRKDGSVEKYYFQCEGFYSSYDKTFSPRPDLFRAERVLKMSKVRFSDIQENAGVRSFDINYPTKLFVNYLGKELEVNYRITRTSNGYILEEYHGNTELVSTSAHNFDSYTKFCHKKDVKEIEMLFNFFMDREDD